MQREREREGRNDLIDRGDPFDAFQRLGSIGSRRTMMPSLFGERDPFDDPFFTRPFGSMFESSIFDQSATSRQTADINRGKGVVIEELDSDYEEDSVKDNGMADHTGSGKEPSIEHPDDIPNGNGKEPSIEPPDDVSNDGMADHTDSGKEPSIEHPGDIPNGKGKEPSIEHPDDVSNDGKIKNVIHRKDSDKVEGKKPQTRSFSYQTSKVTYGGVDGAYYSSTKNRKTGSDGVVVEERKEADRTTGKATHRISRGIHDKGHSVTRNLNSDGKVDTTQTLHNLNEDELAEFEDAWKGNGHGHLPDWRSRTEPTGKALWDRWKLPFRERARNSGSQGADNETRTNSGGRTKKVVRINIE